MRRRRWLPSQAQAQRHKRPTSGLMSSSMSDRGIRRAGSLAVGAWLLLHALALADAQRILDSRLVSEPRIHCEESRIRLSIRTNEPFGGNVYAKGFFNKDVCRVRGNGIGNSANITIPVAADCGMRRRRLVDPKGLVLEMTIVLMFHSKFLTRNDKAYHIECVYMELSQKVSNRLDISAIPSTQLSESVSLQNDMSALPKCKYEVLDKDENGQAISFAAIGQPVYHRWICQGQNGVGTAPAQTDEKLYCLTVHSCEVDDGQGNVQKLLDSNGCPVDRTLLDEVDYRSDLEAGRRAFVFKFADRPTVYFGCQLRLELKPEWKQKCKRTSEKCKATAAQNALAPSGGGGANGYGGAAAPAGSADDGADDVSDFPRPSPSPVTPRTTTLATSATTAAPPAALATATRVTTRLSTAARTKSPAESEDNPQEPYSSDIVDVPLSAPAPSPRSGGGGRSGDEELWRTVVTAPKGHRVASSSREVPPATMRKESQMPAAVADRDEDAPQAKYGSGDGDEANGNSNGATAPGRSADTGYSADSGGAGEGPDGSAPAEPSAEGPPGPEEDDAAELAADAAGVPAAKRLRGRLRDVSITIAPPPSEDGATTLVLKRRRTSRSTPPPAPPPSQRRLTHYDEPIDEERQAAGSVGEKFGLKQPRHFDPQDQPAPIERGPGDSSDEKRATTTSLSAQQPRPGAYVDIDVTAPEVDVFDVPQIHPGIWYILPNDCRIAKYIAIAVVHSGDGAVADDYYQYTRASERTKMRDLIAQAGSLNQVCISHQALSMVLFVSSFALICVCVASAVAYQKFRRISVSAHRKYLDTPYFTSSPSRHDYVNTAEYDNSNGGGAVPARRVGELKTAYTLHNTPHSSATIA